MSLIEVWTLLDKQVTQLHPHSHGYPCYSLHVLLIVVSRFDFAFEPPQDPVDLDDADPLDEMVDSLLPVMDVLDDLLFDGMPSLLLDQERGRMLVLLLVDLLPAFCGPDSLDFFNICLRDDVLLM